MTDDIEPLERRPTELPEAAHVIRCFGGIRPTASLLGVAVSTVQGWKERGAIPKTRHQAIFEAAAQRGLDLTAEVSLERTTSSSPSEQSALQSAGPTAVRSPEPAPPASVEPTGSAQTQAARRSGGVAWLALVLAAAGLIAILTQPRWQPILFPDAQRDAAVPTSTLSIDNQIATIERRITGLEGRQAELLAGSDAAAVRISSLEERAQELSALSESTVSSPELASLTDRIAALEVSAVDETPSEALTAELRTLGDRLAELERDLAGQGAAVDQGAVKASIVALSTEVAAWSARLATLEAARVAGKESAAPIILAIGQLDAAIRTGKPFASAFDRVQTLAGDDFIVAGALAPLSVWADQGVPTRTDLRRRFNLLLAELAQPTDAGATDGWWPRIRGQLRGLVTVRRVGDGENAPPLSRAEQAVERGDLAVAVAALEGGVVSESEVVRQWITHAKARLAADAALASLEGHALDQLAKSGASIP